MVSNVIHKKVFLFGAGAVIDWGGPKTICNRDQLTFLPNHHPPHETTNRICCLTHMLRETGFRNKAGDYIADVIYRHLQDRGIKPKLLNFETIISFVEELFSYHGNDPKIRAGLFNETDLPAWIQNLMNFEIEYKGDSKLHYSFSIQGFESFNEYAVSSNITPEQKFCEALFHDMLSGIVGHVSKYAFWTEGNNVVQNEVNELLNKAFTNWMQSFISKGASIRMYTLNYDRIFKHLLANKNVEVFEGFSQGDSGWEEPGLHLPDPSRIVAGTDQHVFYNLHGCMDWRIEEFNESGMPAYQYFQAPYPNIENPSAVVEFEKGRRILLSNIISGYQKVQRTFVTPFRQMLAAFDRDCLEADEIFLIGYSDSDEHINEIVRNAKKFNPGIKITVVNPSFEKEKFMFDFLLHWGRPRQFIYNEQDKVITAEQYSMKAFKKNFGEFLLSLSNE